MQTYSHILIAAAICIPLKTVIESKRLSLPKVNTKMLAFGSLLPDFALILIAIICLTRDWLLGVFSSAEWLSFDHQSNASTELLNLSWTVSLFDDWFFNNSIIITLQNTFHSPLVLIALIGFCYWRWNRQEQATSTAWLFWFFCAALLHTLIDIPLHTTDGPLIFFPINWDYRFVSPISYWDPNHHGHDWSIFEHSLDGVLIIFLFWHWFKTRKTI